MKRAVTSLDGFALHTLENEALSVSVLPELGGKIVSLREKETGFECLFPNPCRPYRARRHGDSFSAHDASGFDDCFPNVDASAERVAGREVRFPDHGEIWTTPLRAEEAEGGLRLAGEGTCLRYDYEKTLLLEGDRLRLRYAITNREEEPIPCLWTMHCLVRVDRDTRVFLPPGADQVLNLFPGPWGEPGELCLAERPELLAMPPAGTMGKYYLAAPVSRGECGFLFPGEGLRLTIAFPPEKLPYLGLWCTMGGYRGDVNAALEPTTGFYDEVGRARQNGALPMLAPGERFAFEIALRLERA